MTTGKQAIAYMNSEFRKTGKNIGEIQFKMSHAEDPFEEDPRIVLAKYLDYCAMYQGYGKSPKTDFRSEMKGLSIEEFKGTATSYRAEISWTNHHSAFDEHRTYILSREDHNEILSTSVCTPFTIYRDTIKDWNDSKLLFSSPSDNEAGHDRFSAFVGDIPKNHPDASHFECIRRIIKDGHMKFPTREGIGWLLGLKDEEAKIPESQIQDNNINFVDFGVNKKKWHATAISGNDWFNHTFDSTVWHDKLEPYFTKRYQEGVLGSILSHYGKTVEHLNKDGLAIQTYSYNESAKEQAKYLGTDKRPFANIDWTNTRVVWDLTHTDSNHLTGITTYLLIPFYGLYDSSKVKELS